MMEGTSNKKDVQCKELTTKDKESEDTNETEQSDVDDKNELVIQENQTKKPLNVFAIICYLINTIINDESFRCQLVQ